jgi:hypothetical protein
MSSPPVPRRKQEGPRRSDDSNHNNGHLPQQLFRTVNTHTDFNEVVYQNVEPVRYQREQTPYELQRRYMTEARSPILDDNLDLRNIRERLIAAETHCHGLENTVLAYEREIHKLRTIVNHLIDDFEVVQSRIGRLPSS